MGEHVQLPAYVLDLSDKALDNLPAGQAMLTRTITNQVGG
jgi:hypothetical protein